MTYQCQNPKPRKVQKKVNSYFQKNVHSSNESQPPSINEFVLSDFVYYEFTDFR